MPSLSLVIRNRIIQEPEKLEPTEYSWINLGRVGYGLINDEGSVHIHMKLGLSKGNRFDYPPQIIDVIQKYYGVSHGIRHNTPHKIENVFFHKPKNLTQLIKRFSGKDKRMFISESV